MAFVDHNVALLERRFKEFGKRNFFGIIEVGIGQKTQHPRRNGAAVAARELLLEEVNGAVPEVLKNGLSKALVAEPAFIAMKFTRPSSLAFFADASKPLIAAT